MPDYTQDHSIPHPSPGDPIRGSTLDYILTDLRDLATGADAAITTAVGTRAPLSHTHPQSDVSGLSGALDAAASTAEWDEVSGRPAEFPPSTHTHPQADVDGLPGALDAAASTAEWGGVSNRPSAFPPAAHTHERLDLGGSVFKLNPAGGIEQHAGGSRRWLVDETGTLLEGSVPPGRVTGLAARLAALEYSSGRRNITSLIPGVVSGELFALRNGPVVSLEFSALTLTPQAGSFIDLGNVIPDGLRVSGDREYFNLTQPVTGTAAGPIRLRRTGALLIYGANNSEQIYGTVTYQTLNAPPANPPGTPA